MGLIIRTAGAKRTKTEIKRDFEYLLRQWEQIRDLTLKSIAPCPIYEEGSVIKRSIRDLYTKEINEIIVEGEKAGGTCLIRGCIPSKAIIHAAHKFHSLSKHSTKEGHMGITLPTPAELNLDNLISWKEEIVNKLNKGVEGLLKAAKVTKRQCSELLWDHQHSLDGYLYRFNGEVFPSSFAYFFLNSIHHYTSLKSKSSSHNMKFYNTLGFAKEIGAEKKLIIPAINVLKTVSYTHLTLPTKA